ncbi:MAG TPA: TolC family outer membrane protein [Micropepsaceae bacterium]|nr:TolC family outer membrane protein [Micropepsaceae bacterium]
MIDGPGMIRVAMACAMAALSHTSARAAEFSLEEALGMAYQTNPKLQAQRAQLRATDEDVAKAFAGYLPQLSASGSYGFEQNSVGNVLLPVPSGHPRDVTVTLTQPVFDVRALNQIRLANASVRAGRAQLTSVEQSALLDAAQAYFDVVADQAAVGFRVQNADLLRQLLDAIRTRFAAGDVTTTDVEQVNARLAGANAEVAAARSRLDASRAAFERAVGRPAETLQPEPSLGDAVQSEEMALSLAEERNPDVVAAREQEQVATLSISEADAARLPTLSIQGQYLRSKDEVAKGINEEALAVIAHLSVPLYQGGSEYAEIRRAQELRSQAMSLIESAMRDADQNVRSAWSGAMAARDAMAYYDQQRRSNQAVYSGLEEQARAGERTVTDVLNAAQDLVTSQINFANARRELYVDTFKLNAAIGRLTAVALNLPVKIYDPELHYDQDAGPALPRLNSQP